MNDHGTHFLNKKIKALVEEFQIHHHKITPYHPQENVTVEVLNTILQHALTKVCNVSRDDWDLRIPTILWAYRNTCKKLMGQTPFRLVYGQETIMPMEYIVPKLRIATFTQMTNVDAVEERLSQLIQLEENRFMEGFHQQVQKTREKTWHDKNIKKKQFQIDDLVLLYDSKFMKFLGKFRTHYLVPYHVTSISDSGAVQLKKLDGTLMSGKVNVSRLKLYRAGQPPAPIK